MNTNFHTLNELNNTIRDTCKLIEHTIHDADKDEVCELIEEMAAVVRMLNEFACDTDEWSCYETCEGYQEQLQSVYHALLDRLHS